MNDENEDDYENEDENENENEDEDDGWKGLRNLPRLIDDYLAHIFAADPIEATRLGVHDHDDRLGDVSPAAIAEAAARRADFLDRLRQVDRAGLDADAAMDLDVALVDAETAVRRHEDVQAWRRAPYWYVERLGEAFSGLMDHGAAPAEDRGRHLLARLAATPAYLATAAANHTADTPPLHVAMGVTAAQGLDRFVARAVPGFAAALPASLQADLAGAVERVRAALADYSARLEALAAVAAGEFACGAEHFDFLLRRFHLLDHDHRSLAEFGAAQMAADRAALERFAAQLDPHTHWAEQVERIKDHHPRGDEFLEVYRAEMMRAREHCVAHDLLTLPAGEAARVNWLPDYLAAGAPLGLMSTTPPFAPGLISELQITPVDRTAPAERQRQHQRDNCYAFARSIAFHELYPGHHLQQVHHKLATAAAPMRRTFHSPTFIEGWGLYTEDLMEETGFMDDPAVRLFKLRNALWRSARVVVDTGLHTRGMGFEDAVDLLVREVHLDRRMAEGEVRRYTTHDNPTYPSAYLLGKTLIHELRGRWQAQQGGAFSLRAFHDRLLSYGSPPLRLVAARMN